MVTQEFPNWLAFEQIVHKGVVVQKQLGELSPYGGPKPGVHHIDGKAALLSLEDARRQIALANLAVQPFPCIAPNLQIGPESLDVFNDRSIQIGHSQFKAV